MTRTRVCAAMLLVEAAILCSPKVGRAQTSASAALTGRVSSQEEGPMEGVVVSAKRESSTITISVVSDAQGWYSFPRAKLEPGRYSLRIRAVGYEMDLANVELTGGKPATADLKLREAQDLTVQLTTAEWLQSMPPDDRKKLVLNCTMCHTYERIVKSHYDTAQFMQVLQRMTSYYIGSMPALRQFVPAFVRNPGNSERFRKPAEFLSTINLSKVSKWEYPLKTLPRVKGRSTRVIITEYELPRAVSQPHDVLYGSDGMAWYMDFGQQFLGKLDPKTGKATEYPTPVLKPEQPRGGLGVEEDKEGNLWVGMQFQAAVAKFDKKSEKLQLFPLSKELDHDTAQTPDAASAHSYVDGKVWVKHSGSTSQINRMDIATGKYQALDAFPEGHSVYGMASDSRNNLYLMELANEFVGKVDANALRVKFYPTPTPDSGPRKGHVDSQDRLWFGEFRGNRVAMFDPGTEQFKEWELPTPWTNPYDAILDKNGDVWSGGMSSDRVVRLNPNTGQITEYPLPNETNIRRVSVDNSTTPVTLWVGNTHQHSIVKVEPLE